MSFVKYRSLLYLLIQAKRVDHCHSPGGSDFNLPTPQPDTSCTARPWIRGYCMIPRCAHLHLTLAWLVLILPTYRDMVLI